MCRISVADGVRDRDRCDGAAQRALAQASAAADPGAAPKRRPAAADRESNLLLLQGRAGALCNVLQNLREEALNRSIVSGATAARHERLEEPCPSKRSMIAPKPTPFG